MSQKPFILDFSLSELNLPKADHAWQQEILDFVEVYQSNSKIPVQSSGSTAKPKSYELPKKAMQHSATLTAAFLGLQHGMNALLCMPVSYIAGKMMVVRAIEIGMKLFCIEPKVLLDLHAIQHLNFAAMTPMQAEKSFQEFQDTTVDKLILGGAKVSEHLEKQFKTWHTTVYETYGMTETITHIAMRELNNQAYFHTLPNIQIRQNNEDCLVIQTPYFEEEIATHDVVELINEHQFKILGRKDNIINSGGLKINPETLEDKLKPYISKPFIIHAVPDKLLGQKVVLVIESEEIVAINYPKDVMAKNKQPKAVHYIAEFPRTTSGKIQRNKIDVSKLKLIPTNH